MMIRSVANVQPLSFERILEDQVLLSFLWRWFFYIKQYGDHELMKVIRRRKKNSSGRLLDRYHISDRDEGHDDDNDKRGSRAYPSRTSYGQTWEIGKSYPWLTEPLRVFGIPISKPLFGIYWVLTNAQIELLAMDVSIVVTDCDKDNKEKKHDTKNFKSPSVSEIEDAAKRWKDKYGNGETAININDYK